MYNMKGFRIRLVVLAVAGVLALTGAARAQVIKESPGKPWRGVPATAKKPETVEIENLIAERRFNEAKSRLKELLRPGEGPGRDILLFLQGKACYYSDDYDGMVAAFTQLREQYGEGRFDRETAEFEFTVAKAYLAGRKRKFLGIRFLSAYEEGIKMMRSLAERAPSGPMAQDAILAVAGYYAKAGQFNEAQQEYAFLIRNFPTSPYVEGAEFDVAYCLFLSNEGPAYDRVPLAEARDTVKFYLNKYPNGKFRKEAEALALLVRDRLAQKEYLVADLYRRRGRPKAATMYLKGLVADYPDAPQAAQARLALQELQGAQNKGKKT